MTAAGSNRRSNIQGELAQAHYSDWLKDRNGGVGGWLETGAINSG